MTIRFRNIVPLVALVTCALAGLIFLQVKLLESAFAQKEQAFRQNVGTALGAAALRLKTGETLSRVMSYSLKPPSPPVRGKGARGTASASGAQGGEAGAHPMVRIRVFSEGGRDTMVVDTLRGAPAPFEFRPLRDDARREGFTYTLRTDSAGTVLTTGTGMQDSASAADKDRFFVVSSVYDDLFSRKKGLQINPALLDSALRGSMRDAGIPLPFSYGLRTPGSDSVLMATPAEAAPALRSSDFSAPLFRPALGPSPAEIVVAFSGRSAYLLAQLWPLLAASVVFIALIAFGFITTVRMILRQQRLAAHMVDFINNMTHEFKTPISTVTLASDAIRRPDVIRNSARVRKYNAMIAEESLRMKKQVDRILEMAVIEEGDYDLALADVDMHRVIAGAIDTSALDVEARGGTIARSLDAPLHTVRGDAVHIANVIRNLLDNAAKYSPGAPAIRVSTANDGPWLVIRVSDRGIGIPAEHQERVFDKYYRVPTGRRHDVKGFGLGLRYVRLLVEAHRGAVTLRSREGEGTEVIVRLPVEDSP